MWKIFPKVRNPWLYQKYHRANRSRLKKVTLFAPDWFSKPYSPQSKNTQFKGVLWGQFAPANGRTEQPKEGRERHCFQFQPTPLPGKQAILICLSIPMLIMVPTRPQTGKKQCSFCANRGRYFSKQHLLFDSLDFLFGNFKQNSEDMLLFGLAGRNS